jgi:hypothetical protein
VCLVMMVLLGVSITTISYALEWAQGNNRQAVCEEEKKDYFHQGSHLRPLILPI